MHYKKMYNIKSTQVNFVTNITQNHNLSRGALTISTTTTPSVLRDELLTWLATRLVLWKT